MVENEEKKYKLFFKIEKDGKVVPYRRQIKNGEIKEAQAEK